MRRITEQDVAFVVEAQAKCAYDLDGVYEAMQVWDAIRGEQLRGLILEAEDRKMLICYQMEGTMALLTCGYRTGKSTDFIADCNLIRDRLRAELREWGVERMSMYVSVHNPEFHRIQMLIRKIGFDIDMIRSSGRV